MIAEFVRGDQPDHVVGRAIWSDGHMAIDSDDDEARGKLGRIFRTVSVAVDDPALRSFGTSGPVVLHPGTLRWFRAAAEARSPEEGLAVRFLPSPQAGMGWDPAGAYRTFVASDVRRQSADRS